MATQLLDTIEQAKLKTIIFNTDASEDEREVVGQPRQKYRYWIGHMYPDDVQAGHDMMDYLITEAQNRNLRNADGKVETFVISGNHSSVSAANRNIGLKQSIEKRSQILHQIFFARWKPELADNIARKALKRYPNTNIVWAANDNMIMGALSTIKTHNPDILTGGMDWTTAALESIEKGELTVSYGGHFAEAAWSMVMIHDYYHGQDFFDPRKPKIKSLLKPLNQSNVGSYLHHFGGKDWRKVDFSKFSKVLNPKLKHYDFSIEALLNQMKK